MPFDPPFSLLKFVAKALANVLGGGVAGDILLEVLPEVAEDVWRWWKEKRDQKQRRAELEEIVQTEGAKLRQQVAEIVQEVAADKPPAVRQAIQDYLNQMPASIRRSMRRPADPSGATVPDDLTPQKAADLLRLLPPRLPRFRAGDFPLAGADWQLEQLLGMGGFGEVWKARNPNMPTAAACAAGGTFPAAGMTSLVGVWRCCPHFPPLSPDPLDSVSLISLFSGRRREGRARICGIDGLGALRHRRPGRERWRGRARWRICFAAGYLYRRAAMDADFRQRGLTSSASDPRLWNRQIA